MLMEACLCTLNMPAKAINNRHVAMIKNWDPTPVVVWWLWWCGGCGGMVIGENVGRVLW